MAKQYFLDANAHENLNLTKQQLEKIIKETIDCGNPMAPHSIGQRASYLIEQSREKIAELLGAQSPEQIIFTHSCTESNYWANCILDNKYKKATTINTSPFEHKSMFDNINKEHDITKVKLSKNGEILNIDERQNSIYVGVQNETGLVCDFKTIRKNTKDLFISDLGQAIGKMSINLQELNVDIATMGAHKFGGMNGVGIIYLKDANNYMMPYKGGQYGKDVPGTPNVLGIVATYFGLSNTMKAFNTGHFGVYGLISYIEHHLELLGFEIIGKSGLRISTTSLLKVPNNKGLELVMALSQKGIYVGLGSACGSMIEQPFPNMEGLGYCNEKNTSFIRISCNVCDIYKEKDAEKIVEIIKQTYKEVNG